MKTLHKVTSRLFKKHFSRLLTIIAIILVSIGLISGIGEVEFKINHATNETYVSKNMSDFYLKSNQELGFSSDFYNELSDQFGTENVMKSFSYETKIGKEIFRFITFNFNDISINQLTLINGHFPKNEHEIVVEKSTKTRNSYALNEKITLFEKEYTVCGIVANPLLIYEIDEPSFQFFNEPLDKIIYFHQDELLIYNDIYVTLSNRNLFNAFNSSYEKEIQLLKKNLINQFINESFTILTLYENIGFYSLISYAQKVGIISIIFLVFFLLITLLVVFSTMTRLLEEERLQIACLKTLGYPKQKIINQYLLFVFISALCGGILAFGVGLGVTKIIYSTFNLQYTMPAFPLKNHFLYYGGTFALIVLSTVGLTWITGNQLISQKPVTLLAHKVPKPGKKVIIEKVPFIWNHLSFKYKSSFRNVLLYISRFLMTVISIIGSTVLVLAGIGLMDCAKKIKDGASLITIASVLIIFSAILCALVIYNITNINVSERKREIATLMVLGYHDNEVTSYIYREIYIMTSIGAIIGIPLGYFFLQFVFNLINFGSIADINWWSWILAPLLTLFFSFLSTKLLYRRIIKTDMNASLKTLE